MTGARTAVRPRTTGPTPDGGRRRRRDGLAARRARTAYLMLLPAIAFFAVFTYLPIGNLLTTSVHSGPQADVFAGLDNYGRAVSDPAVRHSSRSR